MKYRRTTRIDAAAGIDQATLKERVGERKETETEGRKLHTK